MSTRPHGYARYRLDACRCYVCGFAVSEYGRNRQKAIAAGTWQPYMPAQLVRDHLATLSAAGIGYKTAAMRAGVSRSVVSALLMGRSSERPRPSEKIRTETGRKLLSIRPTLDTPADKAVITAVGTRRRIQGLCVKGWSLSYQATRVGWTDSNYGLLLRAERTTGKTARTVAALYDQLAMTDAPGGSSSTRTRRVAAERHYLTPLVWDDDEIDDPAAMPCVLPPVEGSAEVDEHALTVAYLYREHQIAPGLRDELVRRMAVAGYGLAEIAAVARTTVNYASQIRRRVSVSPQTDTEETSVPCVLDEQGGCDDVA